jgi:signal transduction histidine kinase
MKKPAIFTRAFLFLAFWGFLLFSCFSVHAQEDSLLAYARKSGNDSTLVRALEKSVIPAVYKDPEKAKAYAREAIAVSKTLKDKDLLARAYNAMGIVYDVTAKFDSALFMYKLSVENAPPVKRSGFLGEPLNNIGLVYWNQGFNEKAITHFMQSLEVFDQHNLQRGVAHNLNNIALIYQDMHRPLDAMRYHKRALKIRLELNDKYGLGASYSNLGNLYSSLSQLDSAIYFYKQSLLLKEESSDQMGLAITYNNLGNTMRCNGESVMGISFLKKGVHIAKVIGAKNQLVQDYCTLVKFYVEQGYNDTAQMYLDSARVLLSEVDSQPRLSEYYKAHLVLDSATGNYDSLVKYWPKYFSLEKALYNLETEAAISNIQVKYETAEKEAELARQQQALTKAELAVQTRTNWIMGLSLLILLIAFLTFSIYRQQKIRQERLKAEAKLQEEVAKAEMRAKVQEERVRISRDLHDHIGTQLTIITSSLDNMAFKEGDLEKKKHFDAISDQTRETIGQLRETIWAMNNEAVEVEMLVSKLREFCNKIEALEPAANRKIELVVADERYPKLGPAHTIALFRVCQEAVNNALKHAGFTHLQLAFSKSLKGDLLRVEVRDNGKGFDAEQALKRGFGLRNMQLRIEEVHGTFEIDSNQTSGTQLIIELPFSGVQV